MDAIWTPEEKAMVESRLGGSVIGDRDEVRAGLHAFVERTGADELMINAIIYDHEARKRSYEIVAEANKTVTQTVSAR
jgi:alkanesulfonate monooxygenase SsuD/methylene tetrahydromethanopterin reductase-like flavin-dependent oxidoreductase (luciferase family)